MPDIGQSDHPVDEFISKALSDIRQSRGISLHALGRAMCISYQQVQKYESGRNRMAASRLWDCAQALDVPVQAFFPVTGFQEGDADTARQEEFDAWIALYWRLPAKQREALITFAEEIRAA